MRMCRHVAAAVGDRRWGNLVDGECAVPYGPGVQEDIKIRPSARVVLLDDADRLLMLRIHDPSATRGPNPITADFWLLVGGGVQPGETYEQAAYREVIEETGMQDVSIGRCVWTQEKLVSNPSGELELVVEPCTIRVLT
jgi:8-oxo-dGTP pyrophosphatase MutT (NUDIX family)